QLSQFWARMEELGYVEGQNLEKVDRVDRSGDEDRPAADLNALAMELARLSVDVIVAPTPPGIRAAMDATTSIPIVMVAAGADPVTSGFVASLARPGGNVTGVVGSQIQLEGKRLQLLLEAAPTVSKVAILEEALGGGSSPAVEASREPLDAAARVLGVALVFERIETREGFNAAFEHAVAEGAEALLVRNSTLANQNIDRIIGLADRYRLPASYVRGINVSAGGLMAYEPRSSDIARRAADHVDRILRGARPADLPVELPTRYDLFVNMRTARSLGLSFSRDFFAQVDEVIE
ncbi:MAG: hypothetical protein HW416_3388, partial [Chloroflexi bacterium]|nr:hypothetical protein [Chloroflexota bacterium]